MIKNTTKPQQVLAGAVLPRWRIVRVKRAAITRQIIVATPALLEGLQLHYSPDVLFSIELSMDNVGDLVACSRLSESLARHMES